MPEVFSKSKWEKEADRFAAEWKQPTVGGSADPEPFRASRTKAIAVTRGGNDIFQTDEYGVQYFTFEGWKEHQEAATAWMELAGQAFDHMSGGFTRDPVKYDPERHGTGAFSLQMGSDRIVAGGEAGLRAADGLWDFVKGGAKFAARPFQSEKTVDRVKYDQYLELTAKMNALYGVWKRDGQVVPPGTEGAMKVKSPETFAGNMRRAVYGEGDKEAAAIDQMIDPQAADSWSMVLDPVWLIPGGGLAKVQKLLATGARGEKLVAALNKVKNLVPEGGKLSAAAQWAKDAAKATGGVVRNPATRAVGGAGWMATGAGRGLEWAGSKIAKYPKTAFVGGAYAGYGAIEDDRGAVDILAAIGAGVATAKAVPVVLAKKGAALRGVGEFTRGTAKVAEVGTFGRAVQSGMYSAGTNKALKLMDNAPLNAIAHRSGQLANLITKGSAFGAGMGYVIAGKEGAAAGLGIGVIGAPIGALQARLISGAVKFPFYKKNKEGKWEKTEANSILDVPHQDLTDNFLGHMSKGDREALLTSRDMTQEKLYGMALLDAYAKGILKKGKDGPEGDLVIRYMDDSDIRAEFPDQPDWIGKQGVHRAEVDGKPLIIINRNADDALRTLAHELFHPDWKTADGDDPLTGLRAEMQNHLFGVRDGADGVIFDGLFNEKEFLSLENQYLSRLHNRKSKKGKEGYKQHMDENNMQQRRDYVAGEMLSESFGNFAEAAGGDVVAHGRRILRGAKVDKVTAFVTGGLVTKFDLGLLGRMRQALGKMGIEFDSAGTPASSIFKDPTTGKKKWTLVDGKRVSFKEGGEGLTNSPEMDKLIADYVVAKDKVLERLTIRTEGVDEKAVITAKQILEKNDPVLVQKFANTGMFKLDNDGNVVFEGGAPVLRSRTERKLNEETQSGAIFAALDAIARVEFDSEGMVRKENDKGDVSYTGRFMNEEQLSAVLSLPDEVLPRSVKNKISKLNEMMTKGFDDAGNLVGDHSPNFLIQYYAATKGSKYTSKASMSHQLAAPYGWSISQAGNFNLTTLSVGRFEAKIKSWWKKAGESKGGRHRAFTELFDGSQEQFRADVIEYLHNQAAGIKNPNSAKTDAIADFLNALPKEQKDAMPNRLSTDKEHVVPVSLRVDRMESIQSSLGTPMPVNYARLRVNYKPTTPKGDEGAQYMPKGKKGAGKDPYSDLIYRDEKLPKGVIRDEQANLQYKGKQPKDWTPEDFEAFGEKFGVKNLGPLSEIQTIKDKATGHTLRLPGGLEGKFTYYDLLWIKNNNPEVFPRSDAGGFISEGTHAKITDKLARTLTPPKGDKLETFNRMVFGMLSPNTPLLPNLFGHARTKFASIDDVKRMAKMAELLPENPTQKQRKAVSDKIKKALGIGAADKGGLGIGITQDFTNVAEFARLWLKDPEWFNKSPDEGWATYVDRVGTQLRGLGTKTASFGGVWQDPSRAMISAVDRHMARMFAERVLEKPEMRDRFEAGIVRGFNKLLNDSKVRTKELNKNISNIKKRKTLTDEQKEKEINKLTLALENRKREKGLPDPRLKKSKTLDDVMAQSRDIDPEIVSEWIGQSALDAMGARQVNYRTVVRGAKGETEINPNVAEANRLVKFIKDPEKFKVMSDAYMEALKINEEKANEMGVAIFPAQWTLWDRVRGRIEPHEVMFPGFHKLPKMGPNQIRGVLMKQSKMGYATAPRAVEAGTTSPASMAYFMPAGSDASYMKAAKKGDTKGAQLLVDQAAKVAGYTVGPVLHGTAGQFNKFSKREGPRMTDARSAKLAFFFTDDPLTAKAYAIHAAEEGPIKSLLKKAERAEKRQDWDGYEKAIIEAEAVDTYAARLERRGDARVIKGYLKGDFAEVDAGGKTPSELASGDFDTGITREILKAKRQGREGVKFINLDDAVGLYDRPSNHYAIFDPNQIKSAEAITKDNKGNIIPLSERFNPGSDDIRYMPAGKDVKVKPRKGSATARKTSIRLPLGAVAKQLRLERDLKKLKRN
jgi:hypothetical protein